MLHCTCPNCGKALEIKDPSRESMFCEYCGAKIQIRVNINATYSYSEHKETSTHTEHIVDDAKIKNAENINRIIGVFASPFEAYHAKKEKERREAEAEAERQREAQRKAEEESAAFRADMSQKMESLSRSVGRGIAFLINKSRQKPKQALLIAAAIVLFVGGSSAMLSQSHKASLEAASHAAYLNQLKEEEIAASHQAQGEAFLPKDLATTGDYRIPYKALRDAGFTNITLNPKGDLIIGYFETENDITEITVDGSPSFDTNIWIQADTPIIISYHSFAGKNSASAKIQNTVDAASSKVEQAASSLSSALDATVASPVSYPVMDQNVMRSYSYDHIYVRKGDADSSHYWLLDNTNHFACMVNTYDQSAYFFSLPSDDYSNGFKIPLGLFAGYTLRSNALDTGLLVQYDSAGPFYFQATSKEEAINTLMSMEHFYDLRSVSNLLRVPANGVRSSETSSDSTTTNLVSSDSTAASSKSEPSLDYTPSHSETNYDDAYCLRYPEYANYCLISYQDKIVRFFTYGNDSTASYVGHITGGSKSKGFTVHYNYDSGWDETIKIVGSQMILTDGNGFEYTFGLAPLSPVRDIYTTNRYRDIPEN